METLEELRKWVETLSVAEKRFIKLLGKARAGNAESQQLELLDWVNRAEEGKSPLPTAKFMHNLPTVANRLKDLILDGLRLLGKEASLDAQLRTTLDEVAILFEKQLYHVVARQLRRTKKVARAHCRYAVVLQAIEWEQRLVQAVSPADALAQLHALREEEKIAAAQWAALQEVRFLHETLRARTRVSFPRDADTLGRLRDIDASGLVQRLSREGAYLEQALAVNVLAIKDLCEGHALSALNRYAALLQQWALRPQWQKDQSALFLLICSQFQIACFYSPISPEEIREHFARLPDFKGLGPATALEFQRILYRNQLTLSLNTGNLEAVAPLIGEIDAWLQDAGSQLPVAQTLLFLHNLAIAEFLRGRAVASHRFVQRILNLSDRKTRQDVREFALVLQAVLQFDLGDHAYVEHLLRAGRRHFDAPRHKGGFELSVFGYLEKAMRAPAEPQRSRDLAAFVGYLEERAAQQAGIPVIGFTEVLLWAQARRSGRPIREVFLQAVRDNLSELGEG